MNLLHRNHRITSWIIIILFQVNGLYGQNNPFRKGDYVLTIPKINSQVKVDGLLNEPIWDSAGVNSLSWLHYPVDTGRAYVETQVRMMYDERNLYMGFVSKGSLGEPVVQSLKRDDEDNSDNNDGITIAIDPANKGNNGYFFRVNAAGAMVDGTVYQNGMYPSGNIYWDNKWAAEVHRKMDTLYYEVVIPLSAIKYKPGNNTWGVNFLRNDVSRNQTYAWTFFPANKHNLDMGFTGNLVFNNGLSKSKSNRIILMPSVTGSMKQNFEDHGDMKLFIKGGFNARLSLNSSLNLDLSAYPDFSNVKVDEQYIDFYRFEYYQPEQRSFFLENNDLFTNFGTYDDFTTSSSESRVKPVYTRRIGKADGHDMPIVYGVRLSGEVGGNTRIGLLSIQTERSGEQEAQNYLVGSFQKRIFKRSAIKGILANRNANNSFDFQKDDFNRIAGVEFDYSTVDGKWAANLKLHSSFTNEHDKDNLFYGGGFTFFKKKFKTQNWVEKVNKNYVTDIGFVPRLYYKDPVLDTTYRYGYTHFTNKYELYQYLNNKWIIVMGEYINFHTYLGDDSRLNEFQFGIGYWSVFANKTHIILENTYTRFDLMVPHDVLMDNNPVPVGTYENNVIRFLYETDKSQKLKYKVNAEYGGFYKGEKLTIDGGPAYTFQPFGTISLNYNYTDINLKHGYGKVTYHLLGLKPEISFTTKLLWSTLIQYNTQLKNISFNSIFQWRYAPMSDFYIVLRDDASLSGLNKSFELSFKLTYWLGF